MKASERERLTALLARCHDDPDLFNSVILGRPPLWWRQVEIASSVVENRVTVAYSGNAIGKDYLVGDLVPWWLYTRANSLVIVTGPSQTLLGTVTWKEIRKAIDGARVPLGAKLSAGVKTSPQTVKLPGHDWQALGYSTTNVERASGQHNRKLFVIVEEASGVEDEVWEALDGLKFTRLLAIGNPVRSTGKFIELIRQAEQDARDGVPASRRVHAIQVPSTDSPHADLDESPYGLADRTWLEAMFRRYGKDSLWCASHVFARIPSVSSEALIPSAWLDRAAAVERLSPLNARDPRAGVRRIACDLGEGVGRDATCVIVRDDLGLIEVVAGSALGLAEAAETIARLAMKWRVEHGNITYDRLGVGRDLRNHLARHGITAAVGYAGSAEPRDKSQFTNIRGEAAWRLRQRLDPDWPIDPRYPAVTRPPFAIGPTAHWPMMREELAALTYDLAGKKAGQTRLISKKDLVAQVGRSPDRSDALIQSFAFSS